MHRILYDSQYKTLSILAFAEDHMGKVMILGLKISYINISLPISKPDILQIIPFQRAFHQFLVQYGN